jgi:hypothetical protein
MATKWHRPEFAGKTYSEFDTVVAKLIESLRPLFAAHPDVDEVRLNVIDDTSEPYRAFKKLLVSFEGTIKRPRLETMDELWYHNESSEAIDTLIENLIELEPHPTLTDEQRVAILRFTKEEDRFQEQQWRKYHDEMGPEKLEQYGIKKPRSLTAAFMEGYPTSG